MLASCRGDDPLRGGREVSAARPPSRPAPVPAESLLLALNVRGRAGFFLIPRLRARASQPGIHPGRGREGGASCLEKDTGEVV